LKRVVVIGHSGVVTFDALRWIADLGASFTQIDADGQLIIASGPRRLDESRVRRNQAMAAVNGVGMAVGRELVRRKLEGQLTVLAQLGVADQENESLAHSIQRVDQARTPEDLRVCESTAANAYWAAWATVPAQFPTSDRSRLPEHWLTFCSRSSSLTGQPRRATNPANAILNYLYALVEAETTIALLTMGLDPGMGFFHVDKTGRASLASDVMEAIRPDADSYLLELLSRRIFRAADFFERRDGVCRLTAPMTAELSETASVWGRLVAPIAEWVAEQLNNSGGLSVTRASTASIKVAPLPTKLTESRRSARHQKPDLIAAAKSAGSCAACGVLLASRRVKYCVSCREKYGHRGRSSSLAFDRPRPTEAEIRRFFRALRDLTAPQWARIDEMARAADRDVAIIDRVEELARTRRKRVPVRLAKDTDLGAAALAGCPVPLRQAASELLETLAMAAAVRDELAPGEFERLYEPCGGVIPQQAWAGDELLSREDRDAIVALHSRGISASRLAHQLGISRESVLRRLPASDSA
jgi:CRISPR-associated endonuclease Cas1